MRLQAWPVGDAADFIETDSLRDFGAGHILRTVNRSHLQRKQFLCR